MRHADFDEKDLTEINCPVCNSDRRKFQFLENRFKVWTCLNCSHIYVSPQPNKNFFKKWYADDYNDESDNPGQYEDHRDDVFNKTIQAINNFKKDKGDLLDIGSGFGGFLEKASMTGWNIHGLELNKARHTVCMNRFSSFPNENFIHGTLEDTAYEKSSFDVIVLINVIEHVKDPIDICKRAYEMLRPGGCIVIRWPQFTYRNSLQFAPEHLHGFTGKSIRSLLKSLNYKDMREYWAGIGDFTKDTSIIKKYIAFLIGLIGRVCIEVTFGRGQILFLSRLILARKPK